MREFILRARKARTDHHWSLDDLPAAGRIEIVCACVMNALYVSNKMRTDTKIHIVLDGPPTPPKIVTFDGSRLVGMNYHERAIAQMLQEVLKATRLIQSEEMLEPHAGIFVQKKSFESLVRECCEAGKQVLYLDPDGADVRDVKFEADVVFVFGDYIGMPAKSEKLLDRIGAKSVTLGRVTLFASQCVTIANNEMDRFFYK